MNNLAETYLRQAKGFLRVGDAVKAAELLEKARVLSGDDAGLQAQVLEHLSEAYFACGQHEKAERCRQRVECMPGRSSAAPSVTVAMPVQTRRRWPLVLAIGLGLLLVSGVAVGITWLVLGSQHRNKEVASEPTSSVSPTALVKPAVTSAPVRIVATAPASAPAASQLQDLLRQNVAFVVVVGKYEGTRDGKQVKLDWVFGSGTAFAVHSSGLLLTNRHVAEAVNSQSIPATLAAMGEPKMVLRDRELLVCLGADDLQHFPAKVLYQSDKYDVAVLKIDKVFPKPLRLSSQLCTQGDTVFVCGYPGLVQEQLTAMQLTAEKKDRLVKEWDSSGHVRIMDVLSPDSFDSTLTKGIVSAPERNIKDVSYMQTDAVFTQGNSGGPVLNDRHEVVGIATLTLQKVPQVSAGYNFALLIDQLHAELDSYLQEN